ncbi:50S ribosomal protein L23 [Dissulfurirhabdus thermomarina]|uniref:Large ribosomal subunit protein uL23 n=1 Tax=Dissulfurirhabdus thermomarina TaxID=1765737 RepID=A0A6N9TLL3_DISTH|nr:50S ribosomal protein L23 [Dissulfurirhabdus thermomarina]NDY41310.1 50S ribosomal protein L23 [Dissulfurirhabdus thermomarina]NMX23307.1 50S ribosomal protein L23 [Dissulfurirhabdus thermomarina]
MSGHHDILKAPLITEKSTLLKETSEQVVFRVDRRANKIQVRQAVEALFNVKVQSVRMVNVKGKPKRMGRHFGRRSATKKAIVRLRPGDRIDFFEGV